ncbi:MAG: 50S ribosomal protein L13 [Candidatus Azambacteria bacterium]|nr:50S ribosomal protein L13 [Candidatus Azambacteria bacterium]
MERKTHTIDASGKSLGRLASAVAVLLRGKHKATFERHIDAGDIVVVCNLDALKITGTKRENKEYYYHTGHPGGFKTSVLGNMMEKNPGSVFRLAVYGMLPKNKLRAPMIKRLIMHRGQIK